MRQGAVIQEIKGRLNPGQTVNNPFHPPRREP